MSSKRLAGLLAGLSTFLLAACAGGPETLSKDMAEATRCETAQAPVGTTIVRRGPCIETTEASRDEARQKAEAMRESQRVTRPAPAGPAGR